MTLAEKLWEEFVQKEVFSRTEDDVFTWEIWLWFRIRHEIGTSISYLEEDGKGGRGGVYTDRRFCVTASTNS